MSGPSLSAMPLMASVSSGRSPDRTKQEVRDELKALHTELDAGIRSSAGYTVRRAVEDWPQEGLDGRSERTRGLYEGLLDRCWRSSDSRSPHGRPAWLAALATGDASASFLRPRLLGCCGLTLC